MPGSASAATMTLRRSPCKHCATGGAREGLKVRASLDRGVYPTKIKVRDEEFAQIRLSEHEVHGEWNYTISPRNRDEEL